MWPSASWAILTIQKEATTSSYSEATSVLEWCCKDQHTHEQVLAAQVSKPQRKKEQDVFERTQKKSNILPST